MATLTADKPKDAIAALLQERQRYEQWLAALESRRGATPPNVYSRVRTDYEGRLSRVIDDLGGRTAELQQVVDSLSSQVASIQSEESVKRDLQAEAELRAAVGEYSPEQWREVSQTSQAELARLATLKADAASELAQIQQLLNMASARRPAAAPVSATAASAAPSPAPPAPASRPAARPGEPVTGGRVAPRAGEPTTGASRAPRPDRANESATFDELAFLHSVVEPKPASAGGATRMPGEPSTRPPVVPPPPPPIRATPAARPAILPTSPAQPPAPVAAKQPSAVPAAVPAAATVTPPEAALINTTSAPATDAPRRRVDDSHAVPLFLRDVPSEQVKTLKCAECGTMNFPTEWYCERCGGELAAM